MIRLFITVWLLIFSSIVYSTETDNELEYLDLTLASNVINEIISDIPDDLLGIARAPFDSPDAACPFASDAITDPA